MLLSFFFFFFLELSTFTVPAHAPGEYQVRPASVGPGFGTYLPAAEGHVEEGEGDGHPGHGVCGRHAVLGVVEHLHFDHGRRGGPGPAEDILRALPQIHDPDPDHDEPSAHERVYVPDHEGEKCDIKHFIA